MDGGERLEREELEAALEVRRELGVEYEPALVDTFADRIEQAIEARVGARLAERKAERKHIEDAGSKQMAMGITSLALGIPISAIAEGGAGLAGLVVAWGGIVGVNVAVAWQNRSRLRP